MGACVLLFFCILRPSSIYRSIRSISNHVIEFEHYILANRQGASRSVCRAPQKGRASSERRRQKDCKFYLPFNRLACSLLVKAPEERKLMFCGPGKRAAE